MVDSKIDDKHSQNPILTSHSASVFKDHTSHTESSGYSSPTISSEKDSPLSRGSSQEDASQEESRTYITGWKLFSLMFALVTSVFVVLLDMIIIVTAIPKITSTFHSLPDVGWYGAAYNLARYVLHASVNCTTDRQRNWLLICASVLPCSHWLVNFTRTFRQRSVLAETH